jgi:hypothetical protein
MCFRRPEKLTGARSGGLKLFLISVIALVTAGINSSLRASVASTLRMTFFDPINRVR